MKKYLIIAAVALIGLAFYLGAQTGPRVGGPIDLTPTLIANASSSVTSTASLLFTIPSGAQAWRISNIGNADAYISATTTKLTAFAGFWLDASSSETFAGDTLWTGPVYGITEGGSTTSVSLLRL